MRHWISSPATSVCARAARDLLAEAVEALRRLFAAWTSSFSSFDSAVNRDEAEAEADLRFFDMVHVVFEKK